MAGSLASSCVRVDPRSLSGAVSEPMHLLPCQIQREGAANVKGYFAPAVKDREGGKEVSFRGRTLKGQEVSVPSGYMGVVLREDQKPCSEEEDRLFTVKSTFRSFTQWNLETPPSADDVLIMSLIWPKIAAAVSGTLVLTLVLLLLSWILQKHTRWGHNRVFFLSVYMH
ncbi:hypothetical protein XENTR_v10011254 [Xenopus tropicalis]|nr:hypothetical protein XENTR_v10011254 [Xenopus tropicalis]